MLSVALKSAGGPADQAMCKITKPKAEAVTLRAVGRNAGLKEINPANLKRTISSQSLDSDTFGTCFLVTFHGVPVVIKVYKGSASKGASASKYTSNTTTRGPSLDISLIRDHIEEQIIIAIKF